MLNIENLHVTFQDSRETRAVRGISFHMNFGETLGIVGESGSGKTLTARCVMGLLQGKNANISGKILFEGHDILSCSSRELRALQGKKMGMVFQEPMTSLNPLMRVGKQVEETLKLHTKLNKQERYEEVLKVMELVDLPNVEETYKKYPHQLSGGQRQRLMIASAVINQPELLILDEATTALDSTVQAQIIELLKKLNQKNKVGLMFISHDLRLVSRVCENVIVMYQGKIVESGKTKDIFLNPQHDYTKKLIGAVSFGRAL